MVADRKAIRTELHTQLSAYLVGEGNPLQALYKYPKGRFTYDPVGTMASLGSFRPALTGEGMATEFLYGLIVWLRWNEDEASDQEDRLDDIEKEIASFCNAYRQHDTYWTYIDYDRMSECDFFDLTTTGEGIYRAEMFALRVRAVG